MTMKLTQKDVIGPWTLLKRLGKGGHAYVWLARSADTVSAVKILRRQEGSSTAYRRFRTEVSTLEEHRDVDGVLPFERYNLPDEPSTDDPAWLSMPVATPVDKKLRYPQPVRSIAEAVVSYARTLAVLHDRGVAHRDIKPGNLYWLKDKWYVGDFGLVYYPEKEALSQLGARLGPAYFHAPEMLEFGPEVDPYPADVYSLAKTLWVIATGQRFPPPGPLDKTVNGIALSTLVAEAVEPIDVLLHSATMHEPSKRPSMAEFAEELENWINPMSDERTGDDPETLFRGIRAHLAPELELEAQRRAKYASAESILSDFEKDISRLKQIYSDNFAAANDGTGGSLREALRSIGAPSFEENKYLLSSGKSVTASGGSKDYSVESGVVMWFELPDRVELAVGHAVTYGPNPYTTELVSGEVRGFILDGPKQSNAVAELRKLFWGSLDVVAERAHQISSRAT